MTGLEILDTAVKIGLGAVLGGAFGILTPLMLTKKEVALDRRNRRLRHMEEGQAALEQYLTFIIQHAATTSHYYTCFYDGLPELPSAKRDFDRDMENYDARQGLSITAATKMQLLGHTDLVARIRGLSDMMHAGLEHFEKRMTKAEREAAFYDLRARFSTERGKFYEAFRQLYAEEPELKSLWPGE